jgi:hypothetical protein
MSTPLDSGHEPADLSELTATDALLDRLGARNASDDDLLDSAAAALAELVTVIDQSREPDTDAARLIEVLAGRPLYIAGAEPAAEPAALIIDLTDHEDVPEPGDKGEQLVPGSRLPAPAVIPIRIPEPVGPRRWDRVMSHVSLPAAAVLLLVAIGGGVSAAVTGDPMTPVNGISRVVAQLPGVEPDSLEKVKTEILAAERAVLNSDVSLAQMHLRKARAGLSDVPDSQKVALNQLIAEVSAQVSPTPVATVPSGPGTVIPTGSEPDPNVVATPPVTQNPPADPDPGTDPDPKPDPTSSPDEPEPTSEPTPEPEPEPTSAPTSPDEVLPTEPVLQAPAVTATAP